LDDALRLGLAFHVWPFREPAATLSPEARALILERTLAIMPPPPRPEDDDV
jgi:hypothetical protein